MKCQQCDRPSVLVYDQPDKTKLRLCIDCAHKLQGIMDMQQSIADRRWLQNAAILNQAQSELDSWGFGAPSRMIPVSEIARAMSKGSVHQNFHLTNSTIGLLNTGAVETINAMVTVTQGSDAEIIGQQIKSLTQAILDAQELDEANKRELLQLVQGLSQEIVGGRKQPVMKSLLKSLEDHAQGAAAVVTRSGSWPDDRRTDS